MTTRQTEGTSRLSRKRVGAGALFVDDSQRVLLVEPTYKDYWELPGGIVEENESPYAAAAREVGEELGLTLPSSRLLTVDWVPPGLYPDDGVMFIYDGGILSADQTSAISLQAEEIQSWAWCDPLSAASRLPIVLARRVAAAHQARINNRAVYLENGFVVA